MIALGFLYVIQIVQSLFLFNDMYYSNISNNFIGYYFIISVLLSFAAMTILIYGLLSMPDVATEDTIGKMQSIELTYVKRKALSEFEIYYMVNYALLVILCILYFIVSMPVRIPTAKTGGLSIKESLVFMLGFVSSIGSMVMCGFMIYNACVFGSVSTFKGTGTGRGRRRA